MKYRFLLLAYILVLQAGCCMAQNKSEVIDTAYLRCQYKYTYIFDSLKNKWRDDQMILLIGKKYSKFYSYYTW